MSIWKVSSSSSSSEVLSGLFTSSNNSFTLSGKCLILLFTVLSSLIFGSDDNNNLLNRSLFVSIRDDFLVKCFLYFFISLFLDSWASSLNWPIGNANKATRMVHGLIFYAHWEAYKTIYINVHIIEQYSNNSLRIFLRAIVVHLISTGEWPRNE